MLRNSSIILMVFVVCVKHLFAAPSGNIQLLLAAPDPATAGDKILFQIIALNTGAEIWKNSQYFFEVEIYDANKNYIIKTDKITGKSDIVSSETTLIYIPFNIPTSFDGDYFYKASITVNNQKVFLSEFQNFTVVPLSKATIISKPSKVSLGGNTILSYKQSIKTYEIYESSQDYTGSFNINLVGKTYDAPVSLNLYALYNKEDNFDLDNFLFNFYGKTAQIAFGDIQPSYNSLVLYGAGVRGLNISAIKERFGASVVGAESSKKVEGTETINGTFERYLYGGEIKQGLDILNAYFAVTYIQSIDDKGSINVKGPSLLPIKNNVIGGTGYFELTDYVGIKGEYAQSDYWEDISSGSVKDNGLKATLSLTNISNTSFIGSYSRIEPDFRSLGAPSSTNDKEMYEVSTSYSIPDWVGISAYYNISHDNLVEDSNKTTTNQNLISSSLSIQRPTIPMLTFGYSINSAIGDPDTSLNNQTVTPSASISQSIGQTTLSISYQNSKFTDKTKISEDLKTDSGNLNISTRLGKNISISAGSTLSKVYNLISSTVTNSNSYSMNVNFANIIENKLSSAIWGSYTKSHDYPLQSTDNENITGTAEISYNIKDNLSATIGFTHTEYINDMNATDTYKDESGNIRLSMSF
ncbi:MAG: hypothetical protein A2474_02040 [Elusimicrobia bacterium RIFOXYC2_FULL_34_12]|nr:MAG: hypothetical protein A2474_02040 [Elusimicrobia bacterium RIFOXYC2_FULL_34_12]